jgi:cellulose synthase/poly-beta-1,6-N-acetylglucosamine synthase-like glycosyltransferase
MVGDFLIFGALAVYIAASVGLLVYGINSYVLIALHLRSRKRERGIEKEILERFSRDRSDVDLPVVTTQLPIFNERNVIERLLRAVCAFDYPRDRHEIQVLDDSTDETTSVTAHLVTQLRAEGHDVHHLHRTNRRGYKAGALADGLLAARGEFVAIFDADFVPPPDFLRQTVPFLLDDPRCGFVQTRWGHRNRSFSLLTRLQGLGIDGHFVIEQAARAWNGLFFNFNGTAGIWRTRTIADAGGWNADTLTEDLDLSYRALLAGWKPRYLLDVVTPAEIPTDINALKSQQRRWATGSIQCAIKMLPRVMARGDLGIFTKIQAALHLTHYLIHPLILVMTTLILPLVYFLQIRFTTPFATPLVVVMFLALFGPASLYVCSQVLTGQSRLRALIQMPAMITLGIGLAVNNSRAVFEAFLKNREREFVRTPKLGYLAENHFSASTGSVGPGDLTLATAAGPALERSLELDAVLKIYRQPLSRLFIFEIFMGIWSLAAFLCCTLTIGVFSGALLLMQAAGFFSVGIISVNHQRRSDRAGN